MKTSYFCFNIADNGPGIMTADFKETSRIGLSTKGENRGYGLYLVNKALTELDGKLMYPRKKELAPNFK